MLRKSLLLLGETTPFGELSPDKTSKPEDPQEHQIEKEIVLEEAEVEKLMAVQNQLADYLEDAEKEDFQTFEELCDLIRQNSEELEKELVLKIKDFREKQLSIVKKCQDMH